MQLDLDKLKEYELRNILRGMGIEVQGAKCAVDLKKILVQNVPEMQSDMEARYYNFSSVCWFSFIVSPSMIVLGI